MKSNHLILGLCILGAGIIGAAIFLFDWDDPQDEGPLRPRDRTDLDSDEPARMDALAERTETVITKPAEEEASAEDSTLPLSFRQSLGKVIGRVIEEDGTALSKLKVEAYSANISSFIPDGTSTFDLDWDVDQFVGAKDATDEDGRFELVGIDPRGTHLLGFDIGGGRAAFRVLDHAPSPGEVVDLGDITLGPYVTLIGTVTDVEGVPIEGARVRATEIPVIAFSTGIQDYRPGDVVLVREAGLDEVFEIPAFLEKFESRLPFPTVYTDAEGKFRIEGVPVGLATIVVDTKDFLTKHQGPIATGRSGEKDIGRVVMERGVTLRGIVVDSVGEPVEGAEVMAGNRLNIADVGLLHPAGRTDAEGRFVAKAIRPGIAYAAARRGPGQGWVSSDPVGVDSEARLVLPANYHLTIRTLGPDGEPIDAKIRMTKSPFGAGPDQATPTMFDRPIAFGDRLKVVEPGVTKIENLAPAAYSLRAWASGHVLVEEFVAMPEADHEVVLSFEREVVATVRVVDDATGKPVEHAKIFAWPQESMFFSEQATWGRTDAEGRAELHGLSSGFFKASVEHPAYAVISGEFEVPGPEATLRMIGGGVIEGFVLKGGEAPVEPMMVMIVRGGGGGRRGGGGMVAGGGPMQAVFPRTRVTDPTGHFRITHVDPGNYQLMVYDRLINQGTMSLVQLMQGGPAKQTEVEVIQSQTSSVTLDLLAQEDIDGPTATLRGVVMVSGVPAEDYMVGLRGTERPRRVFTDENGFFDFGRVPADKLRLRIEPQVNAGMMSGGTLYRTQLELSPGEIRNERIDIAAGRISGFLLYGDTGAPAVGATVSARGEEVEGENQRPVRLNGLTDTDGRFEFAIVPEGDYNLSVESPGYAQMQETVRVLGGGRSQEMRLSLEPEAVVEGPIELVGLDTEETRFVWLRLRDENKQGAGDAEVDLKEMTYRIGGLSPGKYTVLARAQGRRFAPVEIDVPRGGRSGLALRFTPPESRIQGVIEVPTLENVPARMMVIFHDRKKYEDGNTDEPMAWATVSRDDMAFMVEGLEERRYKVVCIANGRELTTDYKVEELVQEDVTLVFR